MDVILLFKEIVVKILDCEIDWELDVANSPRIKVFVDSPCPSDFVYTKRQTEDGYWLYWSEKDGFVSFFSYKEPGRGFGGATFNLPMEDGSTDVLVGLWSSREGVMSQAGFPCSIGVSCAYKQEVWDRGGPFLSCSILYQLVESALPAGIELYADKSWGEIHYYPTLKGMTPDESKNYLRKNGV